MSFTTGRDPECGNAGHVPPQSHPFITVFWEEPNMHAKSFFLRASSALASVVVAIAVATAVSAAEDDVACEVFTLRHCDANAATEALRPLMASLKSVRIEAVVVVADSDNVKHVGTSRRCQYRVIVVADSDSLKRVAAVLSELEREREAEKRQRSVETEPTTIPELDAEEMTDAQMRQAIDALSRQLKELNSRVGRLEEAQKLRIVPLESRVAPANDAGFYEPDEITPPRASTPNEVPGGGRRR